MSDFDRLIAEAKIAFEKSLSINELDVAKSQFLGKSGALSKAFKTLSDVSPDEKRELGQSINLVKVKIEKLLSARKSSILEFDALKRLSEQEIDISLPGRGIRVGAIHPVTRVIRRVENIFKSDRYWKIMNYLASPYFDAQTMMGTLPIQHYVSEALDNHIKGISRISPSDGDKPLHVNFL